MFHVSWNEGTSRGRRDRESPLFPFKEISSKELSRDATFQTARRPRRDPFFSLSKQSSPLFFPSLRTILRRRADPATEKRLKELEQKLDVLTKEIEALRLGESASAAPAPPPAAASPAAPEPASASASRFGLGPAASRVYAKKGVSIGGYGEVLYQSFASSRQDGAPSGLTDTIDLSRAVLYFGYKFDDHFVFNSELEYEHGVVASDKEGEAEVEFAYVDWLSPSKAFRARAGLVLVPLGFLNELHEPPTFFGARRNDVETLILPTTWRELGLGGYGEAGPLAYRLYLVNGLNSEGYTGEEGSARAARKARSRRRTTSRSPAASTSSA